MRFVDAFVNATDTVGCLSGVAPGSLALSLRLRLVELDALFWAGGGFSAGSVWFIFSGAVVSLSVGTSVGLESVGSASSIPGVGMVFVGCMKVGSTVCGLTKESGTIWLPSS